MEKKDKELYSYKQALSQPFWIQKLNDNVYLPVAIRLSRLIYFLFLFILIWYFLDFFFKFFPYQPRVLLSIMLSWVIAGTLSEMIIDGKSLIVYIKDYFIFYFKFGMREKKIYINKGQVYNKPKIYEREDLDGKFK